MINPPIDPAESKIIVPKRMPPLNRVKPKHNGCDQQDFYGRKQNLHLSIFQINLLLPVPYTRRVHRLAVRNYSVNNTVVDSWATFSIAVVHHDWVGRTNNIRQAAVRLDFSARNYCMGWCVTVLLALERDLVDRMVEEFASVADRNIRRE